jgi:hypothetical protein
MKIVIATEERFPVICTNCRRTVRTAAQFPFFNDYGDEELFCLCADCLEEALDAMRPECWRITVLLRKDGKSARQMKVSRRAAGRR